MSASDITLIVIKALGGLALFLYGMSMLGSSLEKIAGGKLEKIISGLTSNVFKGVLIGFAVTAIIQSSSATTVIVVGMVNAGIMKLSNAIGVIMGANIGTTVTGQILRLSDLSNGSGAGFFMDLLKTENLASIIATIGLIIFMLSKRDVKKSVGEILIGLGILFIGMNSMGDAVEPLSELEAFRNLFETLSNPFLGVLAGAVVTAIIQSSSASVGILQVIASKGVLTFSSAFPIIMGQNIGTCVTSMISSIGANKNAKRAAFVHLYFNVIGTILFLITFYSLNAIVEFSFWDESIGMGGIANFHTFFNVVVTICLLPFTKLLEKLAVLTIRDKKGEETTKDEVDVSSTVLEERLLQSPSLAIQQASNTITAMGKLALYNFREMRNMFDNFDEAVFAKLSENEANIDRMEDRLNAYLVKITECELTDYENRRVTELLHLNSEFERIGDYTMNLIEDAQKLHEANIVFSESAQKELNVISDAVEEIVDMAVSAFEHDDVALAYKIEPLEETIDYLNETLKARHIERLKSGKCVVESGVNFLDLLINLERISDHCSNTAIYIIGSQRNINTINRHEFIENAHKAQDELYAQCEENYRKKYAL